MPGAGSAPGGVAPAAQQHPTQAAQTAACAAQHPYPHLPRGTAPAVGAGPLPRPPGLPLGRREADRLDGTPGHGAPPSTRGPHTFAGLAPSPVASCAPAGRGRGMAAAWAPQPRPAGAEHRGHKHHSRQEAARHSSQVRSLWWCRQSQQRTQTGKLSCAGAQPLGGR